MQLFRFSSEQPNLGLVSRAPDSFGKASGNFSCAGVGMLTPRSDWSSHMIARLITGMAFNLCYGCGAEILRKYDRRILQNFESIFTLWKSLVEGGSNFTEVYMCAESVLLFTKDFCHWRNRLKITF